jgi:uncharacterized protein DUF1501
MPAQRATCLQTRRNLLSNLGGGLGLVAFQALGAAASPSGATGRTSSPLSAKSGHHPAKAKRVIFLVMNGGLSQVDTFDSKPLLDRYHAQSMPGGNPKTERKTGNLMKSPFKFNRHGQSGLEISEIFPGTGEHADRLCVIRSMHTDIPNHEPSLYMLNCGENIMRRPSMGSWLTYGLGTENQNLPGYVVLCPGFPVVGSPLWNSSFLPAIHQGAYIPNNEKDPNKLIQYIRNLRTPVQEQRRALDFLRDLNQSHLAARSEDSQLEASIESMEIAFRMQMEAPEAFNLNEESSKTLARYGDTDFGRGCLMARRLTERGVRVVQVYYGNGQPWDNHDDIMLHQRYAKDADRAVAALLWDLQSSGLLNETLVVFGTEFGRTPAVETSSRVAVQNGRDHNPHGFSVWLAGGGVRGGMAHGATDDLGFRAVDKKVHVHDLHATILHLMGLDHLRLTFQYSGREFRLTDVHGQVVNDILA